MGIGEATIRTVLGGARDVIERVLEADVETIETMAAAIASSLRSGGKILLCGNGGSAADAQHLAGELLVRLRSSVDRRALPAIALAADSAALSACGNDYGFERVFSRMVEALGRSGDVLVVLSTSGNSANVVEAAREARARGIVTLGLVGCGGGALLAYCDHAVVVPSDETGRIQEAHIAIGHALVQASEEELLAEGAL